MTSHNKRVGLVAFPAALWSALQWRVMLIFIVLMALPTAIATVPIAHALGSLLDHSVQSSAMARHFIGLFMGDALFKLGKHGAALGGAQTMAFIVTLALSPFLTGVIVTAARGVHRARFGELMHGGMYQYWRMLRLMLWSLVPYAIAFIIGGIARHMASNAAASDVLQSSADRGFLIARIILIVLLVLAHVIMESSRAQIAADEGLRSATRAFGRGIATAVRRPLATLGLYVATSVVGYVLAGLVGMWRIRTDAVGLGLVGAVALTQLIVVILAWQRIARIDALARIARATPPQRGRRRGAQLAPAV
jgi:hypothetical protein